MREWHGRRAYFVRRFRASFYSWCTATAVMYEARAQRGRAVHRLRLRCCRKALTSWISSTAQVTSSRCFVLA